jgi:archaellum component FlaC
MANKINPFDPNVNSGLYNVHFPDFAFWLQKTQPLVYDDALSYYEVLCRVSAMLNQLIKQVNDLTDAQKKFIEDATNLLNQIINEWNSIVDQWNSIVDQWNNIVTEWNNIVTEWNNIVTEWNSMKSTWSQWSATWAQWVSTFAQWTETFNNMVQNNNQFQTDITNQFNSYKNEINNIITNFENEVNEKIKDFVTIGILEHVVTYGGIWEQVVTLEAGASTRILLPESMQKNGLYFLANASIDCEGIIVNVDKWTVVAYNASAQTRNPNLQVYALGEFGILSQ